MTQVGQLIMIKTVPFYSLIRSFELRAEYDSLISVYYVPPKRRELTVKNAKWFLNNGSSFVNSNKVLTNLLKCCKEYISIAEQTR